MCLVRNFLVLFCVAFSPACFSPMVRIGGLPENVSCLAVLPFEVRFEDASSEEMLSEFMTFDFYRMKVYGVLAPKELKRLFEKAKDPLPPVIDPYWAKKIGQRVHVDAVVFGSFSRLPLIQGSQRELQLNLDVYLLDVRTGEVRWTYGVKETVEEKNYIQHLSQHSDLMVKSLLKDYPAWKSIGKPNCWKAPKAGETLKSKVRPKPLTPAQRKLLEKLKSSKGLLLGANAFIGREAQLTKKAVPFLRTLAKALLSPQAPKYVRIHSHVDHTKRPADDLRLSKLRALQIKRYLAQQGVPENRIQATGYGGTQPRVPNLNKRSRSLNRRVIFIPDTSRKR